MDPNCRKIVQTDLENAFVKDKETFDSISDVGKLYDTLYNIDYFVTTIESTHQSHRACNDIAITSMRSPYIERCKNVLFATYPQDEYGIGYSKRYLNSYISLTEDQAIVLSYCIGTIYGCKNWTTTILGADNFLTYLSYFGNKCGKDYAQPFVLDRGLCTMGLDDD